MGQLEGKVAIITGGGSGIGKAIAKAFIAEGCAVTITGRTADRLNAAAAELSAGGGKVLAIPANVANEAQVAEVFRQTMAQYGKLDILVNSAGNFDGGPIENLSLQAWQNVVDANLTGPFLCSREAFRIMKPAGGGRILNIGSISAQVSRENSAPYTATKFGVEGLTRACSLDGRAHNIVVSCLHPGNVLVERRAAAEGTEPMMAPATIASVALFMVTLPPDVKMLDAIELPDKQLYVGRG
jgi:NAD(P)-dependent dehydrogenase (short-subunit alcohol dehydrogenase family)